MTETPPVLPYRIGFLCPVIDDRGHEGDVLCELLLQWLAHAVVQSDTLVVIPPERFPATDGDLRLTYEQCESEDGLAERYMHARIDELLWLEIDAKSGVCRLLSRRFLADIDLHGEMGGPLSDVIATLLDAWARSRSLGRVVDLHDRLQIDDLRAAARLYDELCAAIESGLVDAAFALASRAGHLQTALLATAVRKVAVTPDDRFLEASAPRTVRALKGDALAYAYFAWSLAPDDAGTLVMLAETLAQHGRHAEAQRMADRAARIVPSLVAAHALALRETAALSRPGEAYAEALERQALLEDAGGESEGAFADALVATRRAIGRTPHDPALVAYYRGDVGAAARGPADRLLRARALLLLERPHEAAQLLDRAATPAERLALCEAWSSTGREAEALLLLAQIATAAPQDRLEPELGRMLRFFAGLPIACFERALERAGASPALVRRIARDAADAHPEAGQSPTILSALGERSPVAYEDAWLDHLREGLGEDRAERLDRLFAPPAAPTLSESDRMLGLWHALIERFASEIGIPNPENPDLAPTLTYISAQAVSRYLAAVTGAPTPTALAYRQIAVEALAAARVVMLDAEEAILLLRALEPAMAAAPRELADLWFGRIERAFDLELCLGAHRDAYCADLPTVRTIFLGDEHLGALHARAKSPEAFARLGLHTGAASAWERSGDGWLARFIADPFAVLDSSASPVGDTTGAKDASDTLRTQAFLALEASELGRAQAIAAKAVAEDSEDWSAWLALLVSSNYRAPGGGNDLPADGLTFARNVLELSQGAVGAAAGRLRLYASRIIESRSFSIDRLPPVE